MTHITSVTAYQIRAPFLDGSHQMSRGRSVHELHSLIVKIETAGGLDGWGEIAPLGSSYGPAYFQGAITGVKELAPSLIGLDAANINAIELFLGTALGGHNYVKSAIDIACWDIFAKALNVPLYQLLGGILQSSIKTYKSIPLCDIDRMAKSVEEQKALAQDFFQIKVGSDPAEDIAKIRRAASMIDGGDTLVVDANGGWSTLDSLKVIARTNDIHYFLEQPCENYEDCLVVRRRTGMPFILDESVEGLADLRRIIADGAADAINVKLSRVGGITKARRLRDIAQSFGILTTIEDSSGTDITGMAILHLAHSMPRSSLLSASLGNGKIGLRLSSDFPDVVHGSVQAPSKPGLGITPSCEHLGSPIFQFS